MGTLKLGAIVEDKPVRITVELPAAVQRDPADRGPVREQVASPMRWHGTLFLAVHSIISPKNCASAMKRDGARGHQR